MPPSVFVALGPSRAAAVALGALGIATLALVLTLPIDAWQQALLAAWVGTCGWHQWRALAWRRGRGTCVTLRVAPNRLVTVAFADGRVSAGLLRGNGYVSARLTTIVWRADGERRSRSILILPDMLPPEDFRRLRVMLRYARSGDAHDLPASHA